MPIETIAPAAFEMTRYTSKPVVDLSSVKSELRQIHDTPGKIVPINAIEESPELKHEELTASVSQLNDYARQINRDLKFTIDEELNRVIVQVYNAETDEMIRQIPPEEVLAMARYLAREEGTILDTEA